jgi:hypothetical protein
VLFLHLHSRRWYPPLRMQAVEIEFRPVSLAQLTRPHEQERSEPQSAGDRERTGETVDSAHQLADLLRVRDACVVSRGTRQQRLRQPVARRVLADFLGNGVLEDSPAELQHSVRRLDPARSFDPPQHAADIRPLYVCYRVLADPGEDMLLEPAGISRAVAFAPALPLEPFAGNSLEGAEVRDPLRRFRRLPLGARVDAVREKLPSFVSLLSRTLQGDFGINAEG